MQNSTAQVSVNGAEIAGNVFLRDDFKAEGGVDLVHATIGGNLDCDGGQFVSKRKALALDAGSVKIDGYVSLGAGMFAEGIVNFAYAYVTRSFQWCEMYSPENASLDLRFTKVGTLFYDQKSSPSEGHLYLNGLVYDQIDDRASPKANVQLNWLKLQPPHHFLSQPFEQLAAVLRKMGLEDDRRKVMIEKNKNQAAHLHRRLEWLWYGLFGKLIGYGYRPWRAFWISLLFIGFGCWLFNVAYNSKVITPPDERAYIGTIGSKHQLSKLYPRFDAFGYSVETFVPFLKLGVSQYWMPNATCHGALQLGNLVIPISGRFLRYYLWLHITAGCALGRRHNRAIEDLNRLDSSPQAGFAGSGANLKSWP